MKKYRNYLGAAGLATAAVMATASLDARDNPAHWPAATQHMDAGGAPGAEPGAAPPIFSDGTPGDPADAAIYDESIRLIDIWLNEYRQYEKIPALSAAVIIKDRQWSAGYGTMDRAGRKPATADTVYSICSISKLFTAIAFMQQWEKGNVRLDDRLTDYLPWAELAQNDWDSVPITMRGLLTHSAGLPREAVKPYWTGPNFPFPSSREIREGIATQHLLFPASRTHQYSNLGLTLVGEVVAQVSGVSYADYVTENILNPLNMGDTRPFIQSERYGDDMAVGWGALRADGTRARVKLFDAKGINPAAGFSSSVNDLARFADWQLRLLKQGEGELLRASTLREMHRVHYLTPDRRVSWGLGFANFQFQGREIVGHGGSCPGYRSQILIDPLGERAVIIAMNAMESAGGIARRVTELIAHRADAKVFPDPEGGPVDLAEYAGFYDPAPWDRETIVVPWAGGLAVVTASDDDPAENLDRLKPLGADHFRVVARNGEERDIVTFHRNKQGKVTYMSRFGQFTPFKRALD